MPFAKGSLLRAVRAWIRGLSGVEVALDIWPVPAQYIVRQMREAGATSPETARAYRARSVVEEQAFIRLRRQGVIREPRPGRYYIDERTLATLLRRIGESPFDDDVDPLF